MRLARCLLALVIILAAPPVAAQGSLCGARLNPDDLAGYYVGMVDATNASFFGAQRTQQGFPVAPFRLATSGGGLLIHGWPRPGTPVPLRPVGSDQGRWNWQQGPGGLPSSDSIERQAGCSTRQLPRYEAYVQVRDPGTGLTVEHRLILVATSRDRFAGYWTFNAQAAGLSGNMVVVISR